MNKKLTKKVIERILKQYSMSMEEFAERTGIRLTKIKYLMDGTMNLYCPDKTTCLYSISRS